MISTLTFLLPSLLLRMLLRCTHECFGVEIEQVLHQVLRLLNHVIQDNSDLQENACLIGLVSLSEKNLQHILSEMPVFVWRKISVLRFIDELQIDVH